MENFKNNSTAIDFLKKNKVRLQSLAAAVIVAGSLVGCSKEETPVETSPAELYINNSIVITTDTGKKHIVKRIVKSGCDDPFNNQHYHYYDVVTKNYYSDSENCEQYLVHRKSINPIFVNVTNIENIADYLTTDEFTKLMKDELSIDDCVQIVTRIKESEVEEVKTK